MASVDFGHHGMYFNKELVQKKPMQEKIELSLIDRIESIMAHFEKALDYAGCTPGICFNTLSGAVRIGYGVTQLIIAVAIKIFAETALAVAKGMKGNVEFWEKTNNRSMEHIKHGLINIGRGVVESIPLANQAFIKLVQEREILVCHYQKGQKAKKCVNTNNKSDMQSPPLFLTENNKVSIWSNRFHYEGELKRMHLNIQEEANKHIIPTDDTKIVLNSVV